MASKQQIQPIEKKKYSHRVKMIQCAENLYIQRKNYIHSKGLPANLLIRDFSEIEEKLKNELQVAESIGKPLQDIAKTIPDYMKFHETKLSEHLKRL